VRELGRRLVASSIGETHATAFVFFLYFQRLSIAVQMFNAVLIRETFDLSDGQTGPLAFSSFIFSPWTFTSEGTKIIIGAGPK